MLGKVFTQCLLCILGNLLNNCQSLSPLYGLCYGESFRQGSKNYENQGYSQLSNF